MKDSDESMDEEDGYEDTNYEDYLLRRQQRILDKIESGEEISDEDLDDYEVF